MATCWRNRRWLPPLVSVVRQHQVMPSHWPIPDREEQLRGTAGADLPVLALADEVTRLMLEVVQRISIDAGRKDRTAADYRLHALWFMTIIAMRAFRAAMQAFRSGYEEQAVGYQRLIEELHGRAQQVRADQSGEIARNWLDGRNIGGKGAKLAGRELWDFLSGPVHANVRAVLDWIAVSQPDGSARIVVGPERRAEVANAALAFMAGEGRDLASMLAAEAAFALDLAALDARLSDAHERWIPDQDE
jgi:hypothetical protein